MARTSKDSLTYWREREIEHARTMLKDEKKISRKIAALYRDTSKEIEREIEGMLARYAHKNEITMADVRKLVTATDIRKHEAKAARYVREKDFSPTANAEMSIYNLKMRVSRLELTMAYIDLELIAMTDGVDNLIHGRLVSVGEEEIKRQAGILGRDIVVSKADVAYIAARKFHGDDFSNRLWKNKRLLHRELEKRLTESITRGQHPRVAARKLRETIDQSKFNADRIMITESARVQSESQMMAYERAGYEKYEFITTEGACKICEPLDGRVFNVKDAMPGLNISPLHPHCRCGSAAYMSRENWEADLERRGL